MTEQNRKTVNLPALCAHSLERRILQGRLALQEWSVGREDGPFQYIATLPQHVLVMTAAGKVLQLEVKFQMFGTSLISESELGYVNAEEELSAVEAACQILEGKAKPEDFKTVRSGVLDLILPAIEELSRTIGGVVLNQESRIREARPLETRRIDEWYSSPKNLNQIVERAKLVESDDPLFNDLGLYLVSLHTEQRKTEIPATIVQSAADALKSFEMLSIICERQS